MKKRTIELLSIAAILLISITVVGKTSNNLTKESKNMTEQKYDTATFGTGCFWCTEAFFEELKGVKSVKVGYSGGHGKNPTYMEVVYGNTGYAEVAQIIYDPSVLSFKDLLEVFWKVHDPTSLNKQGADKGPQYRSVIFYHNPEQEKLAKEYKMKLDESGAFSKPIVTEIVPYKEFYAAENYHQDYYKNNPDAPYCTYTIKPKLEKFREVFGDKLKK